MNFKDNMKNLGIIEVTRTCFFFYAERSIVFSTFKQRALIGTRYYFLSLSLIVTRKTKQFFFSVSYSLLQLNYNLHLS